MKVKSESEVAQWCQTLRDLMDCSLPGSSIHGIFQARVLLKFLIMHSSTIALDSLPPILLTFSDLLLLLLFILCTKFLVPYVLLIFPFNETLILPFHLLSNWDEKSLTCQIPEGEGGSE